MRVFVAGASGAIGRRLVPQLVEAGHEVIGTHNSPLGAGVLRELGATPVRLDLLEANAVRDAVLEHEPEAIVHQATALANVKFGRNMDRITVRTRALRTSGTDALLAAAWEVGARFVAQSVAGFGLYAREGGPVKTEEDPVDASPPASFRKSAAAIAHLEDAVTGYGGTVLRYGVFYGADNDGAVEPVKKRQFPIVGDGSGIWSWIHLDDAAAATVLAVERGGRGAVYNVVDDEPAPVREWLPVLADALGAGPPRRVPVWLARLLAGEFVVILSTDARGASNAKAKRELGWQPRHPSWRLGFEAAYG